MSPESREGCHRRGIEHPRGDSAFGGGVARARRYARCGDEEEEVQVLDGRVGRDATVVSLLPSTVVVMRA